MHSFNRLINCLVLMLVLFYFSQTWPVNLRIQELVFSGCALPHDSNDTKVRSNNQKASLSASLLVSCCAWNCAPTDISGVNISTDSGCVLLQQMSSQWGPQKLLQKFVSHELIVCLSLLKQFLTQWIMAILSKGYKPDKFESQNSLRLSFTNIWDLCSNFIKCESFLESNDPEILAPCNTNLDDAFDSSNFSVRGYLPLMRKHSITHVHGLTVYVKEGLPFPWDLSLENFVKLWLALLHSVSYFFFLYWWPSLSLCTNFNSISCNIDEVLSINRSANGLSLDTVTL